MKSHVFQTLVTLVLFTLLAIGGACLIWLPQNAQWISQLTDILQKQPQKITNIGLILVLSSVVLFTLFYWIHRKSYYYCEVEKKLKVSIAPKIIQQSIQEILQQLEPAHAIPFKVNVHGKNIELITDLSQISYDKHEAILDDLEPRLNELFKNAYGEPKKISLAVAAYKA